MNQAWLWPHLLLDGSGWRVALAGVPTEWGSRVQGWRGGLVSGRRRLPAVVEIWDVWRDVLRPSGPEGREDKNRGMCTLMSILKII